MASDDNASIICINSILPDEILEEILSELSLSSIIRARLVCKSWNSLLRSASFPHRLFASPPSSRKSWFLSLGYSRAYDLSVDSWRSLQFPSALTPFAPLYFRLAFSPGLFCAIPCKSEVIEFHVCNPITGIFRRLPDLPCRRQIIRHKVGLSMSAGRVPGTYIIVVITKEDVNPIGTQIGIHVYSSEKLAWETREDVFLPVNCISREQSCVICNEVLYFQCSNYAGKFVGAYDLSSGSRLDISSYEKDLIRVPHANGPHFHRSFLMDMRGKLVMVGLSKESVKVMLLDGKEWVDVATMPDDYIRCLRIHSTYISGYDEIIYINETRWKVLVIFDMATRCWRRIEGSGPDEVGTYFEPRLDAIP